MGDYVLVVEGDELIASSLEDVLQRAGFRAVLAANGQEALVHLEQQGAPALVVTDLQMPVMDGFKLAAAIKADERWHSVPVMAMSGAWRNMPAEDVAFFSGFINKPFSGDVLLTALPPGGFQYSGSSHAEAPPEPASAAEASRLRCR